MRNMPTKEGKANPCFVAGTKVKTQTGYKAIETIQAGDIVASANEHTGKISYKKVKQTFIRQAPRIYKLTYNDGTTVETTGDHPFFINGKGWTTADKLSNGDISPTWAGLKKSSGVVENEIVFSSSEDTILDRVSGLVMNESLAVVDIEVIEEETTVYNFEVEDDHTYFVTEAEVWVHNADYGGDHGKDRYLTDAHQIDYTNANLTEEELKKIGKLTPTLRTEIKEKLQNQLEERANDYIEDQVSDFIKKNCGSNSTDCPKADELRNKLHGETSDYINRKLNQFDSPTVGYDFFNNEPVKAIDVNSKNDLNDVTKEVESKVALAQLNTEYGFVNRVYNGLTGIYKNLFSQSGELDFKNNEKIMKKDAKLDGFQGYVVYKDKIFQQSDLGNMVFGHIMHQNAKINLGKPNDEAIDYRSPASSVFSIGHDRQVADHEEYDRVRDQKAMAQGYKCGMDVSKNCVPSNINFGSPKYDESRDGRVIRQYYTPRNRGIYSR
jgi:hypothetical protein